MVLNLWRFSFTGPNYNLHPLTLLITFLLGKLLFRFPSNIFVGFASCPPPSRKQLLLSSLGWFLFHRPPLNYWCPPELCLRPHFSLQATRELQSTYIKTKKTMETAYTFLCVSELRARGFPKTQEGVHARQQVPATALCSSRLFLILLQVWTSPPTLEAHHFYLPPNLPPHSTQVRLRPTGTATQIQHRTY